MWSRLHCCFSTSWAAAVTSTQKPLAPRRRSCGAWSGVSPSLIGTPPSFSGCSARFCGRSAKAQSDVDRPILFVHLRAGFGVAEIVEDAALFDLSQEVIRIFRIEGLALLHGPQFANGRLAFEIEALNGQLAEHELRPFVNAHG